MKIRYLDISELNEQLEEHCEANEYFFTEKGELA
jgi:hypothetical protein